MVSASAHRTSIPRRALSRLNPRQEPYELKVHVRIRAGGARQRASLPRYPIGKKGGLNEFEFVLNSSLSRIDYLGMRTPQPYCGGDPTMCIRDTRCYCDQWIDANKDLTWIESLPHCPCYILEMNGSFTNPDPTQWTNPEPPPAGGHPGASLCIRSTGVPGKPGQQCCFDSYGALINKGPGAGSVDKVSPRGGWSTAQHGWHDWLPFHLCPTEDYNTYRPADLGCWPDGTPCPINDTPPIPPPYPFLPPAI